MSPSQPAEQTTPATGPASDGAGLRFRARYTKTGKLRFVSAIDLGRLWERALRKAQLPIAYSEGFSPHPKVSFPDALPLGYASTGEYAELTFAAPVTARRLRAGLNAAFPEGMRIVAALGIPDGAPRLAKWLRASVWQLDLPESVDDAAVDKAAAEVLAAETVVVGRQRKDEITDVDVRPAIAGLVAVGATVRALVHHVEPPVRPSELHLALTGPYEASTSMPLPEPALVTRVAQGTPSGDGLAEALSGAHVPLNDLTADAGASTPPARGSED